METQTFINQHGRTIAVGVVSGAIGFTAGYLLSVRKTVKILKEVEAEYADKKDPNQLSLDDMLGDPRQVFNPTFDEIRVARAPKSSAPGGIVETVTEAIEDALVTVQSVFTDDAEDQWDYEAERGSRDARAPYIIHVEEFMADEMGFSQSTVQYYEGDHVLTDEHDTEILNHEKLVGKLEFGHGSGDRNVVYVRNERLHQEWEILRSTDHYQSVVLGNRIEAEYQSADLKHSTNRRFRDE